MLEALLDQAPPEPVVFRSTDGIEFAYAPTRIAGAHQTPWHYMREPVLRVMPDGSYQCLHYSGGDKEPAPDNVVLITRSTDGGASWTEPQVLFRHDARPCWATELYTGWETPCAFVHTFLTDTHYLEIKAYLSHWNAEEGWSFPVPMAGRANFSVRQGLEIGGGKTLFPVYWQESGEAGQGWKVEGGGWNSDVAPLAGEEPGNKFCCGVAVTCDQGKSFQLHGHIAHPTLDLWEPTVAQLSSGKLVMLMRSGTSQSRELYSSQSGDGGITWSAPQPTSIPNPSTKPLLFPVGDAWLLFNNPHEGGWTQRHQVEMWVSTDDMATWTHKKVLASAPEGRVVCYPHVDIDRQRNLLLVALDTVQDHWLLRIPLEEIPGH